MPQDNSIRTYRDFDVWRGAMALAVESYRLTKSFPRDELFGLTAQIRRASSSISANIAEGYGREHTGSFIQFLRIAQGSLKELETHFLLAAQVGVTPQNDVERLLARCEEIGKMLRALIRSLQSRVGSRK